MSVAERLRQVRADLGGTQAEMAARLHIGLRTYASYEAGERLPLAETLAELSRLGFNIGWLLTGEGTIRADQATSAIIPVSPSIDGELNARIIEAVAATYKEAGGAIGHRDLGRVAAEIYNDIAAAGLESWEDKLAALRLATSQLRRRLLAPVEPNPGSAQGKRMA